MFASSELQILSCTCTPDGKSDGDSFFDTQPKVNPMIPFTRLNLSHRLVSEMHVLTILTCIVRDHPALSGRCFTLSHGLLQIESRPRRRARQL